MLRYIATKVQLLSYSTYLYTSYSIPVPSRKSKLVAISCFSNYRHAVNFSTCTALLYFTPTYMLHVSISKHARYCFQIPVIHITYKFTRIVVVKGQFISIVIGSFIQYIGLSQLTWPQMITWDIFVHLFGVLRPTREFSPHMETSPPRCVTSSIKTMNYDVTT